MGLQSALTTALTGMQAAETSIDVIGNNVANSQTVGFKESEAVFATQFLQTISIGSAPNTNSGGTNPRQIGLGVTVAEISPNFTQGTIEISANPLDVAIQGDGFLIVQSGTDELFTRNGQLQLNADNEIVTSTGQRVLGYGVNDDYEVISDVRVPLTIPVGEERVAQETSQANFSGVLNPAVAVGETPSVSQSLVLGDNTIEQPGVVAGNSLDTGDIDEDPPTLDVTGVGDAVSGSSGVDAGTVNYKFVFLDANGLEGNVSDIHTVDNSSGPAQIDLSNLTQPTSGNWTGGMSIYRQHQTDGFYYFVDSIANTDTVFSDTDDDATIALNETLNENVVPQGTYDYYITYYDPSGIETRPTPFIGTVTVDSPGSTVRLDLTDVDAPTDPNFTQMRIYRNSLANASTFYRIDSDSDPIFTTDTSYVDKVTDDQLTSNNETLDFDGPRANEDTRLTEIVIRSGESYQSNIFQEGTLTLNAEKDGVDLDPKSLDITASTSLLDLLVFMQDSLGLAIESNDPDNPLQSAGSVSMSDGRIIITSNLGEENSIEIPLTAFSLTPSGEDAAQTVPINFSEIQSADGPGTTTEMIVYDSLGLPMNVRITTVLEDKTSATTTYRWYATSGDNEPFAPSQTTVIGDGILRFNSFGDLIPGDTAKIQIDRNSTASESPLEVDLDFSQVKSLGETDAQGNPISALNFTSQDGFPPGVLTDFIISDDGLIQGQFSNGTQRTVGQLVMARFANNSGLAQVGDSLFDIGVNSGQPIFGAPGEEGIGTLTAGAVELSNTDIGQNLIELILASTQYSGAARVITATQELLDELLALQR